MRHFTVMFFNLVLILCGVTICIAWEGKVVGISDGDTITVLHEGRGEKIRLYGIDAPESHQDFGKRAKQFVSNQVFGKIVEVDPITIDRYGRTVSMVVFGIGQNLSEELITAGFAWVYGKYCTAKICRDWQKKEQEARGQGAGLWSQANPIAPWEFRKVKH